MPWEMKKKQEEIIIESDPQLSWPAGKEQAKLTAKYLAEILQDHYEMGDIADAEVFVFSSPFLACLETSAAIAKGLKVNSVSVQD